jgi:hypothetical protein
MSSESELDVNYIPYNAGTNHSIFHRIMFHVILKHIPNGRLFFHDDYHGKQKYKRI